jgi:phenylacetate-CoA ligase
MTEVDISVVAPCYNEARNLPELVLRLDATFKKRGLVGEIVLVNDGSVDDTAAVIDRLAAENPAVVAVHHEKNRGIEAGWHSGLSAATGEYACLIDADLQYLPEDVWRLYRELRLTHADLVQGTRSTVGRLRDSRYILSKGLNVLLNSMFGMSLRDNKSGFVIARRETLQDILRHRFRYFYFQSFITVAAHARGYTIRQVETLFESRLLGKSFIPKLPFGMVTKALVDLVKGFVEFRLRPQREDVLTEFLKTHRPTRQSAPRELWRRVLQRVFFATMPLHKWTITRRAADRWQELERTQWLSVHDVRELQELRLRRLVYHAYQHVPWYRQEMDARGLKPKDVRTLADLQKLPLLTKQDVRENLHFDLLAENHDKSRMLKITTSGSTGEPFVCYADAHQLEMRWAATQRSMEWTGFRFGDRQARLWHQTIGMSWHQVARERIDAWLNRRIFIPAFEMTEKDVARALAKLRRHRPVLVDGYAECFNHLARHARPEDAAGIRPKGIISSAQVLPEDSRRAVETAFGTRVFDKYGSREFSGIAWECEAHEGHHVVAENYVVEILRDGQPAAPGELGEVVVTDLNNFCMPFIRYRIGDLAEAMDPEAPCPCGRGLPRVGRIEGRIQSIIIGSRGAIAGSLFPHVLKDYDFAVRQFQVVQVKPGAIVLKVVKAPRFDDQVFADVLAIFRRYLGEDTAIDVQFVDSIPMVRTGKRMATLSAIPLDFQRLEEPLVAAAAAGEEKS